ncbi:MAG: diaminopimelate epimerase [Gammaproteobacteria bacterium]|nr:diaminopimelate epimerase [Gammaproteobacteria bacterium]
MTLEFTKMHGLGNDFIVLDGMTCKLGLPPERIRAIADRRVGIGCDQVLLLEPAPAGEADAIFRIFNADGSEVDQCGNGARCAADYLIRHGYVHGESVTLKTGSWRVQVQRERANHYRVNMGVPRFDPAEIPLRAPTRQPTYSLSLPAGRVEFSALSLGNPHAVIAVKDVEHAPVESVGTALQGHEMFPRGINAGFMQIQDKAHIRLRVYERGAGETQACGSGACAAVVAGRLRRDLDEDVEVELPGGRLDINWRGEGQPVWMTGPAVTVYEGRTEL